MENDPRVMLYHHAPPLESIDLIVGHPGQPADYVHTDGTRWTWKQRWRAVGGVIDERTGGRRGSTKLRVYDPMTESG